MRCIDVILSYNYLLLFKIKHQINNDKRKSNRRKRNAKSV